MTIISSECSNLSNWYGIAKIGFIYHNSCWADPEIEYRGRRFNSVMVEDMMWARFREGGGENEADFPRYMKENANELKEFLDSIINSIEEVMNEDHAAIKNIDPRYDKANG